MPMTKCQSVPYFFGYFTFLYSELSSSKTSQKCFTAGRADLLIAPMNHSHEPSSMRKALATWMPSGMSRISSDPTSSMSYESISFHSSAA